MESYYLFTMTVLGIPLPTPRYTYICSSGYLSRICGINCVQTVYMYVYPSLSPKKCKISTPLPYISPPSPCYQHSHTYIYTHTHTADLIRNCQSRTLNCSCKLLTPTTLSPTPSRTHKKCIIFTLNIFLKALKLKNN